MHGDFKNRFFYTLGGEPGALLALRNADHRRARAFRSMLCEPRKGIFSGTRILFNFGDAVREPSLTDQFYSLYNFLARQRRAVDCSAD